VKVNGRALPPLIKVTKCRLSPSPLLHLNGIWSFLSWRLKIIHHGANSRSAQQPESTRLLAEGPSDIPLQKRRKTIMLCL
jgi:hypothetical protein